MAVLAQPETLSGPVKRFLFHRGNTIADLVNVVNELEKAGKPPFLKFLGCRGEISALEVLTEEKDLDAAFAITPAGRDAIEEMAVAGNEDEVPDPAVNTGLHPALDAKLRAMLEDVRWLSVVDETLVYFAGNWTAWGELSIDERKECGFNPDGVLVGSTGV